ncbi:hypothetical protein HNP60_001479 [Sphingobium sp. B1D3A]|uniref:Uncharacterized protein n=1 Tax=Sphingobium lignivorans TaxID=2735886 RepID=A0ABR6NDZ5_9SPHN|nr:hypothetical protein [Sphingobium lignivorans]
MSRTRPDSAAKIMQRSARGRACGHPPISSSSCADIGDVVRSASSYDRVAISEFCRPDDCFGGADARRLWVGRLKLVEFRQAAPGGKSRTAALSQAIEFVHAAPGLLRLRGMAPERARGAGHRGRIFAACFRGITPISPPFSAVLHPLRHGSPAGRLFHCRRQDDAWLSSHSHGRTFIVRSGGAGLPGRARRSPHRHGRKGHGSGR